VTAARVLVAVVAVAVLAWLAVMERSARLQATGIAATARQDWDRAEDDFRAAAWLSLDIAPDFRRSFVYQASSRPDEAIAVLRDVVRREPDNRAAWGVIEEFTRERDPALSARAREQLRRLDPLNARR
jgi:tetratricopeptide (TPR) repeat protein